LFILRRRAREGRVVEADETTTFASAIISREPSTGSVPSLPERLEAAENSPLPACRAPGRIEIVLTRGHRVIIDHGVDATVLARVIDVLERRP